MALRLNSGLPANAIVYRDTAGEFPNATYELEQLVNHYNADLVLGPLLSDVAQELLAKSGSYPVEIVTLAKRDELLDWESSHIGWAPPAQSQVYSLLQETTSKHGLRRFAVIYPPTESGMEYAYWFERLAGLLGGRGCFFRLPVENDAERRVEIVDQLAVSSVDGIFFPGSPQDAGTLLANASSRFRSAVRVLGIATWDSPSTTCAFKAGVEWCCICITVFSKQHSPTCEEFY